MTASLCESDRGALPISVLYMWSSHKKKTPLVALLLCDGCGARIKPMRGLVSKLTRKCLAWSLNYLLPGM